MFVMSEFYIASQANFTVTNSRDFDFFFEACPGSKFEVEYLPELCSVFKEHEIILKFPVECLWY